MNYLQDTLEAIRTAWNKQTAAPGTPANYVPRSRGQCAVTALLVHDLLGGDIVRAVVTTGSSGESGVDSGVESHYFNFIPHMGIIDLTREQYDECIEVPRGEVVPRSRLLEGERALAARTPERYALLRERFRTEMRYLHRDCFDDVEY